MGISNSPIPILLAARSNLKRFERAVTLGKQGFRPSARFLRRFLGSVGVDRSDASELAQVGTDGSNFLRWLGAGHVDEIDASPYEGASIIHDMNLPLEDLHKCQYDLVYDGGCIEHIFDVGQVLHNISDLTAIGGIYAGVTVANNLMGHGFYQFSPELFYRYFCPENGWEGTTVFLCEYEREPPRYWLVEDPMVLRRRVELHNSAPLYLMILSRKVRHHESKEIPQQSDYTTRWSKSTAGHSKKQAPKQAARKQRGPIWRALSMIKWQLISVRDSIRHRREVRRRNRMDKPKGLKQEGIKKLTWSEVSCYQLPGSD